MQLSTCALYSTGRHGAVQNGHPSVSKPVAMFQAYVPGHSGVPGVGGFATPTPSQGTRLVLCRSGLWGILSKLPWDTTWDTHREINMPRTTKTPYQHAMVGFTAHTKEAMRILKMVDTQYNPGHGFEHEDYDVKNHLAAAQVHATLAGNYAVLMQSEIISGLSPLDVNVFT